MIDPVLFAAAAGIAIVVTFAFAIVVCVTLIVAVEQLTRIAKALEHLGSQPKEGHDK